MSYWGGVICGCSVSAVLFIVLMFTVIEQNNGLKRQVSELKEMVQEHEKIMRAYEFYNWQYSKIIEKELEQ